MQETTVHDKYNVHYLDGDEDTSCLLYTSDAADERSSVDLGGRRIIKKKSISYKVGSKYRQIYRSTRTYMKTNTQEDIKRKQIEY